MTSQGAGVPFAPGEQIDGWRACQVRGGGFVGSVDRHERLTLPRAGAGGTYRYLRNETPISQAELTVHGSGSVIVRVGQHVTEAQAVSHTVSVDLGNIAPGKHEIPIELVSGAGVTVGALVFR
jgi:arabinoxylan arabinofuranohydrolase